MNTVAIDQTAPRWHAPSGLPIWEAVAVAIAYLIGAEIAFLIGTLSDKIFAPFWPPNIVLMCALFLAPTRDWWIYILAVLPAHVLAELGVGMPPAQMLVAFLTNCLVAIISVVAMRRLVSGSSWFGTLLGALLYVLIAALASPAVVALGGAFVPILGGGALDQYWTFWLQWYLSNALGSLTLGPVALIALNRQISLSAFSFRQRIEAIVLAIAIAVVCMLALRTSKDLIFSAYIPALILLPLTLLTWSAIRFGATGASVAILITTVVAIQQTLGGPSPFIVASPEATVLGLQMFLVVMAVPLLLLGAATEEIRNAMHAARTNQELMALSATAADICLWQYDRNTRRFWMTENGRTMFGLGSDDPLNRVSIEHRIHPEDRQAAINAMRSASAADTLADTEFRIVWPNGETRWLRARGRARKGGQGEPTVLSGTFADVTELRTAEHDAALRRAEVAHLMRVSMLGELSVGIAHELTQPLTAILSNAQAARALMDSNVPNLAEIAGALEDIISDDNRASGAW